jgi:DNA modification methylase
MTDVWFDNGVVQLYQSDARSLPIPDNSVDCVVTSPPYWGLRDYGLGEWEGGDAECSHKDSNQTRGNIPGTKQATNNNWEGGASYR